MVQIGYIYPKPDVEVSSSYLTFSQVFGLGPGAPPSNVEGFQVHPVWFGGSKGGGWSWSTNPLPLQLSVAELMVVLVFCLGLLLRIPIHGFLAGPWLITKRNWRKQKQRGISKARIASVSFSF